LFLIFYINVNAYDYGKVYQALQREGSLPLRVFLTPNYEDIHVHTVLGGLKTVADDTGVSAVLPPHRAQGLDKVRVVCCSSMRASLCENFLVA
jgi:hypothetical protein